MIPREETFELRAALARASREWDAIACATGPADRLAATAAIHHLCRLFGEPAPAIEWFASPVAMCAAVPGRPATRPDGAPRFEWARHRRQVTRRDRSAPHWFEWRFGARKRTDALAWVLHSVIDPPDDQPFAAHWERGNLDGDLALAAAERLVLGPLPEPLDGVLDGLVALARAAGPWMITNTGVVRVADRPAELHLDARGRLHRRDGPAARWSDGTARYALDGVGMPAWLMAGSIALPLDREMGAREIRTFVEDHVPPGWFGPTMINDRHLLRLESHEECRNLSVGRVRNEPILVIAVREASLREQYSRYLLIPPQVRPVWAERIHRVLPLPGPKPMWRAI